MNDLSSLLPQIREACRRHRSDRYFVDNIPPEALAAVRDSMQLPGGTEVIALLDLTLFRGARESLLVCEAGLYWKNLGETAEHLPWEAFAESGFDVQDRIFSDRIQFADGRTIMLLPSELDLAGKLLSDLQTLLRQKPGLPVPGRKGTRAAGPAGRSMWHLSVGGRTLGPYGATTLRTLARSGQFDPHEALVWRDGMEDWTSYQEIAELRVPVPRRAAPAELAINPPPLVPPMAAGNAVANEVAAAAPTGRVVDAGPAPATVSPNPGLVDLNRAGLDELLSLPGVTQAGATRLIEARSKGPGLGSLEEVGDLLGLPPHKLERLRERAHCGALRGGSPAGPAPGPGTSASRRIVDY